VADNGNGNGNGGNGAPGRRARFTARAAPAARRAGQAGPTGQQVVPKRIPRLSASEIMVVAFVLLIVGHWANNKPTGLSGKLIVEASFAILVIAFLDSGDTEPIARGFAWLFLIAVLLRKDSILNALGKIAGTPGQLPGPVVAREPPVSVQYQTPPAVPPGYGIEPGTAGTTAPGVRVL
jgi:hypothetical protein